MNKSNEKKRYCAHCGEDMSGCKDNTLCPDCQVLDLIECSSCEDTFIDKDMIDNNCVMCVSNYRL